MSKSSANLDMVQRRLLPPPQWNPFQSAWAQMWIALATAITILTVAALAVPTSLRHLIQSVNAVFHEACRGAVAAVGDGRFDGMTLSLTEGSHATVAESGPVHAVLVFAAGLVGPAWIGATCLGAAITRIGISPILFFLGVITGALTYSHVSAGPDITLSLYTFAAFSLMASILPADFGKPIAAFLVTGIIGKGVIDSVPHAWVDFIDGDPARPSDAQRIAEVLGAGSIDEVAPILVGAMFVATAVSLIFSVAWLQRHSH